MSIFTKIITVAFCTPVALALATSGLVHSADAQTPAEKRAAYAVDVRQAVFTLMGNNMGPLGAMARGDMPVDTELTEKNATRIAQLTAMIADAFKLNTSEHNLLETEALDVIWDNFAEFEESAATANKAAIRLAAAVSGGAGATKKAIVELGKTCSSCHDDFRVEDDD